MKQFTRKIVALIMTFRILAIVVVSVLVISAKALAQDDPTAWLKALPKDFNYWLLLAVAASMVAHWAWKKFIKKEATPDFLTWYGSNLKMTVFAFGSGVAMLVAQWSVLVTQPVFSFPVLTACFMAGWTADSAINKADAGTMARLNPPAQ